MQVRLWKSPSRDHTATQGSPIRKKAASRCNCSWIYVAAPLITMYRKCRNRALAQQVLDGMVERDAVMWNSLIMGYEWEELAGYEYFGCHGLPAELFHICCLAGSKKLEKQVWLEKGIAIDKEVKKQGFDSEVFVASSLLDM